MHVAIIKYNAGNIMSVEFALKRLGVECEVTDDFEKIKSADKVIFPGVGEAETTMRFLKNAKLDLLIKDLTQPVLGICLGLQLMCSYSEEGDTPCLGIFQEKVLRFEPKLKVPHMGWNTITELKSPLLYGLSEASYVYFVHSFYAQVGEHTIAKTNYINDFSAALNYKNFYATQFHPEKSSDVGLSILKNFVERVV
ncbi:MAG TPA: imidazole glycerol phosphate synthase subunit HisH [Bacteroidales bacterium]|nr:imidazole glycerol phosphate synthase subunit HisH [Bacteroidales bacterium]